MAHSSDLYDLSRRRLLVGVAAASAVVATGAIPIDPIFAAIDAHRDALAAFFRENTALAANPEGDYHPANAACMAWSRSEMALVRTMPTTLVGVEALRRHLLDGSTFAEVGVHMLCDRHAARLAA